MADTTSLIMLWQSVPNEKQPQSLESRVTEAALYYFKKYALLPDMCYLHNTHQGPPTVTVDFAGIPGDIRLLYVNWIRPVEFHIGREWTVPV